jgi:hypothetical protein
MTIYRSATTALAVALVLVMAGPFCCFGSEGKGGPPVSEPGYDIYFGDLHTHTGYSDAYDRDSTPWDAYQAAIDAGADFMAVTDHVQFWNAYDAWIMDKEEWEDTLQAADYFTSEEFVAMAGYETWMLAGCGEVNVFNTREFPESVNLGYRYDRLPNFYDWLKDIPGAIGQFNHPLYVSDNFMDYDFLNDERDASMSIIEVWNTMDSYEDSYIMALDAGWHVMPSANSDTHYSDWIANHEMRSVLLAESLTPEDLYDAMRNCRGYGTLDSTLHITYTLNSAVMGSQLVADGTTEYLAEVHIWDPEGAGDEVTLVEVLSDGGEVVASIPFYSDDVTVTIPLSSDSAGYFFLRVSTVSPLDGEPGVTAWTAPVWTGR